MILLRQDNWITQRKTLRVRLKLTNTSPFTGTLLFWSGQNIENCMQENEQFNNVIFTDECSVLLENHSKLSFHRKWEQPKLKGKPKHPVKVHVWAGISKKGPTQITIFEGNMDAQFFCLRDP